MVPIVAGLLMGAALGGGIAALQKKDVLQGALMGGIGGALGGAFMPAAGGIAGATEGAVAGGIGGGLEGVAGASIMNPAVGASGLGAGAASAPSILGQNVLTNSVTSGGIPSVLGSSAVNAAAPMTVAPLATPALGTATTAAASQPFSIGNFLTQNKYALAGGALGGMMAPGEEPDKPDEGNIRDYTFNREMNPLFGQPGQPYFKDSYTAGAVTPVEDYNKADGGIVGLAEGGNPQDYRVAAMTPADANMYQPAVSRMTPEVAAYNQQMMQRANQQYNINPRPAAMQIPGMDRPAFGTAPVALPSSGNPPGYVTPLPDPNQPNAGIGGLRYDPKTGRYVGDFKSPFASKEKTELEKMREELDVMRSSMPNQDTGGAANGGLMMSYAMGGDIGTRYQSPDDASGMGDKVGAHQTVNMAPHYPMQGLYQGYAGGGHLGDYSDGGRLLKGPGDGVSDDIPAQIGARQPARLADGEFVVPARIVSELGNGSTDAGAKRLYAMMNRVQKNRKKSVGKGKVAVDSKAYRHLPA
jgi:hypothetical protein